MKTPSENEILKKEFKVAIAGNPNSGKTTLFNCITGANQHVGNYPGVTVETVSSTIILENKKIELVDLPGIYGLSAYSEDEIVARNFLTKESIDLIINVVDASNIERNLFLTLQLIDLNIPMIIALNMHDYAKKRGVNICHTELGKALNIPVIPTVGRCQQGVEKLLHELSHQLDANHFFVVNNKDENSNLNQSLDMTEIEVLVSRVQGYLEAGPEKLFKKYTQGQLNRIVNSKRWYAIKILEADELLLKDLNINDNIHFKKTFEDKKNLEKKLNDTIENYFSDSRYKIIQQLAKDYINYSCDIKRTITDKIDKYATHKILGPIILLIILWSIYQFTFQASSYPTVLLEGVFNFLHDWAMEIFPRGLFQSLVVSGIIDGVGGVLGFTPIIIFMFLAISFLEDSGYVARIAFLLDRILRTFGMHGNSILAFIVSGGIAGGCAVPGIMSTRTLKDPKERLATILTVPFMNCGAKLPVYALLIAAFFSNNQGSMMFLLTMLSWFFALFVAGILRTTLLKGEATPFIMELPPYRMPALKSILKQTWQRTLSYINKAGTVILMASMFMWVLMTFPQYNRDGSQATLKETYAGMIGSSLERLTKPLLGFTWETNISLISGIAAKEIIVSTMSTAYSLSTDSSQESNQKTDKTSLLTQELQAKNEWTPLKAFTLMVFIMLYIPCLSVLAVIKRETNSTKWMLFTAGYTLVIATSISSLIFHVGSLF